MAFFPTEEEAQGFVTIEAIADRVGLNVLVIPAIEKQTGAFANMPHSLAMLPPVVNRKAVKVAKITETDGQERLLAPVEATQIGLVWRVTRRKLSGNWASTRFWLQLRSSKSFVVALFIPRAREAAANDKSGRSRDRYPLRSGISHLPQTEVLPTSLGKRSYNRCCLLQSQLAAHHRNVPPTRPCQMCPTGPHVSRTKPTLHGCRLNGSLSCRSKRERARRNLSFKQEAPSMIVSSDVEKEGTEDTVAQQVLQATSSTPNHVAWCQTSERRRSTQGYQSSLNSKWPRQLVRKQSPYQ